MITYANHFHPNLFTQGDRSDVFKALALADTLRQRDLIFHDGGTVHVEAIATYKMALNILMEKRANMIASELSTSCVNERARRQIDDGIDDDFFLDYRQKSVDGLLSSTNSNLAKVFFMANMFESAVTAYDDSLMYKVCNSWNIGTGVAQQQLLSFLI